MVERRELDKLRSSADDQRKFQLFPFFGPRPPMRDKQSPLPITLDRSSGGAGSGQAAIRPNEGPKCKIVEGNNCGPQDLLVYPLQLIFLARRDG